VVMWGTISGGLGEGGMSRSVRCGGGVVESVGGERGYGERWGVKWGVDWV